MILNSVILTELRLSILQRRNYETVGTAAAGGARRPWGPVLRKCEIKNIEKYKIKAYNRILNQQNIFLCELNESHFNCVFQNFAVSRGSIFKFLQGGPQFQDTPLSSSQN